MRTHNALRDIMFPVLVYGNKAYNLPGSRVLAGNKKYMQKLIFHAIYYYRQSNFNTHIFFWRIEVFSCKSKVPHTMVRSCYRHFWHLHCNLNFQTNKIWKKTEQFQNFYFYKATFERNTGTFNCRRVSCPTRNTLPPEPLPFLRAWPLFKWNLDSSTIRNCSL